MRDAAAQGGVALPGTLSAGDGRADRWRLGDRASTGGGGAAADLSADAQGRRSLKRGRGEWQSFVATLAGSCRARLGVTCFRHCGSMHRE